ncbi:xylulokinase [Leucobacter tardus]|uniref:Xylulose kinase n=1 Tax=Leucobacter tardus TaxID=501483 RepID=A0A939TP09_9MICO|nr:FGGY family carbohydrate kinase [Leucobacter tardus]MBO2990779.1 xylulose kinase [Leucobacter tardus]
MSAGRRYVAGIDSSTQSCKVVIIDPVTGERLRDGTAVHPEGTEVHPDAWWQALTSACTAAGGLDDVAAVSIAGQQHGLVALDADGRVVRDALLWNDTRSGESAEQLVHEVGADEYASRSGVVPVASFTAAKLRWVRTHEPRNADRIAAVALPHDWLTWRLLGYGPDGSPRGADLEALTTDASDASGTAYFSAFGRAYDAELFQQAFGRPCRAAGSPATDAHDVVLPRILGPHESAGTTPDGILVGAGAGDNAAAALGLDAGPGDVVVSIGTSGTVFASTDRTIQDPTGTVAGFASATGGHLPLVATLNAARVLTAASRALRADHDEVAALALRSVPGAAGLTVIPYFEGERTPNLPDATARLEGMTLANTQPEHLARAFVEGMLCGLSDGLAALLRLGVPADRLMLIGGAARNPAVREVARHIFTAPIDVPEQAEYVAIGAARQATWALTGDLPRWTVPTVATMHPRPSGVIAQYHARTRP